MNRRGFLGAIAGLMASPILAKIPFVQKYVEYDIPGHMLDASRFVPEIWSTKIAEKFYAASMMDIYTADAAKALAHRIDQDVLDSIEQENDMT